MKIKSFLSYDKMALLYNNINFSMKKGSKMKKTIYLACVVMALFIFTACSSKQAKTEEEQPQEEAEQEDVNDETEVEEEEEQEDDALPKSDKLYSVLETDS